MGKNSDKNNDGTKGTIFDKGSWQHTLNASAKLYDKSGDDRKKASTLLWQAAKAAVAEWADDPGEDTKAEAMYSEMIGIMGEHRKGDASKIKTVALAVRSHSLDTGSFPNLAQAYAEARRLLVVQKEEAEQDAEAEKVIEAIAESAPKTATTPESAAKVLLSKGIDGAVVAILDALNGPSGDHNEAAARSFMRAVSTEISARVKAKADAEKAAAAAARAAAKEAQKAAAEKDKEAKAETKSKGKAAPVKSAADKKAEKAKAAAAALAAKAEGKGVEPLSDEVEGDEGADVDDLLAEIEGDEPEAEENKVEAPKVGTKKAAVRRPVRR